MGTEGLVSIIIPCYNQAQYLAESIESALAQTYRPIEVIVVNDGSTDDTAQVASQYATIHYVRQVNRGLSAARNTGLRVSRGGLLVFLDADDRLLPDAVKVGVQYLLLNPRCAFVSGHYRDIDHSGSPLAEWPHRCVQRAHYLELLRKPYITMHATVMYRRTPLQSVGGFDTSLSACEDYDVYLRIAREYPVACHPRLIAEYRQHAMNMTHDTGLMLRSVMTVMEREWPHVRGDARLVGAYRSGVRFWRRYYGRLLARDLRTALVECRWERASRCFLTLLRYHPRGILDAGALFGEMARSVLPHRAARPSLARAGQTMVGSPGRARVGWR